MSLSLRESRQILKTIPLTSLPTRKSSSRLFRLRRSVLTPSFFSNYVNRQSVKTPVFSIYTSKIPNDVIDNINAGPPWLRGSYPAGTLSRKHEKYRLINHVSPISIASKVLFSSDQRSDDVMHRIKKTRLPILQVDDPSSDALPVVFLTSKKRTHKDAAKRNLARCKVKTAMEIVVGEFEDTPNKLSRDPSTALVIQADKGVINASSQDLLKEMRTALSRLNDLRAKASTQKGMMQSRTTLGPTQYKAQRR